MATRESLGQNDLFTAEIRGPLAAGRGAERAWDVLMLNAATG